MAVEIKGSIPSTARDVLTPEALAFVADLHRRFDPERRRRLEARAARQQRIDGGEAPDFLASTQDVREAEWKVAPAPADLEDRRCEITGPVERKMMINALNSGARVFMADFEDSLSPTWDNALNGQQNLSDAIRRTITFENPDGKRYQLNEKVATLLVRPRGWHLIEKHLADRRQPDLGQPVRLRSLRLPQRQGAHGARQRPLLLPAQAREPSRGAACGTTSSTTRRTRSAFRAAPSVPPC